MQAYLNIHGCASRFGSPGMFPAHAILTLSRFLLTSGIAGRKFGYGSGERRAPQGGGEGGHDRPRTLF